MPSKIPASKDQRTASRSSNSPDRRPVISPVRHGRLRAPLHLGSRSRWSLCRCEPARQWDPVSAIQIEQILPTPDHHAKLRSPIADVIVPNNVVTEELRDARESVAQEGAANVTDMHRLGHVRRSKIDDDFFRRRNY